MNVQRITREELEKAIAHFERFGKTYFWTPPCNAAGRRAEEKRNSKEWEFTVNGEQVIAKVEISCSVRNYYAHRSVTVGEERKKMMVPYLKKCLASME